MMTSLFQTEPAKASTDGKHPTSSSSLSVESLNGSGSLAVSVRPSPIKCGAKGNNPMLASLTKTISTREQAGHPLSASPQTAFQKATSSGGNANIRHESSSNSGRCSSSSSTSTTFYTVSSHKRSRSPVVEPLVTPTNTLPLRTVWCMLIPTVPLNITTSQANVVNIDVMYSHLPEFAAHYSIDMYDYLNTVEDEFRPDHQYLFTQSSINAEQRAYLVNAMVCTVCIKDSLLPSISFFLYGKKCYYR
jgi:hypothetical protein